MYSGIFWKELLDTISFANYTFFLFPPPPLQLKEEGLWKGIIHYLHMKKMKVTLQQMSTRMKKISLDISRKLFAKMESSLE